MNRTISLLIAFCCVALLLGRISKSDDASKPPEVKRGDPITFSVKEYNLKDWQEKTKLGADFWFKIQGNGWYVDWDADRKPFTTIVIHHSATDKDATSGQIEEIQKKNLYTSRYQSAIDPFVKGLPPRSGHVVNGKERFIGYHHLVYHDGRVTTELSPLVKVNDVWHIDHVAWHAGKWDVNCSSVSICLVGDFSEKEPPEKQLFAIAGLLAHYRTINPMVKITGHKNHAKTECPGETWPLWKKKIFVGE